MATTLETEPRAAGRPIRAVRASAEAYLRMLAQALRPHMVALGVVLLAFVAAQAVTLAQAPLAVLNPDSQSYLSAAHSVLAQHQIFNVSRTPGYPVFLALVFLVAGEGNLAAVVYAQMALLLVAALEVYALVYLLCARRWLAAALAALIASNLYILDWERTVLQETLSYVVVVTLFLCFVWYIRSNRRVALIALAIACPVAILTRPALIYLPALLLALLALWRTAMHGWRTAWQSPLLTLGVTYAVVVAYMAGNALAYGYFGLTDVSTVNLFGKVLEYRMQDEVTDARFAPMRADADQYLAAVAPNTVRGPVSAWAFAFDTWRTPPNYQYSRDHFALMSAYAKDVIVHHPIEFAADTVPDIGEVWLSPPTLFYARYSTTPRITLSLLALSRFEYQTYLLLPLALIALAALAWRRPRTTGTYLLATGAIAVAFNILLNAAAASAEFPRLRSPLDWLMIVVAGVLLGVGAEIGTRRLWDRMGGRWRVEAALARLQLKGPGSK